MTSSKKLIRHRSLKKLLRDNPFSTDEQLAKMLDVSVQTIRLDRVALGIPELRARTRTMAEEAQTKLRAIDKKDIVGELLDVTGLLGGYNLHWAFGSGLAAGRSAAAPKGHLGKTRPGKKGASAPRKKKK